MKTDLEEMEFFVVCNNEGRFFRAKGYRGSGDSWVEHIGSARVYSKIGGARSIVSFFAKQYPEYGIPKIIKMKCLETEVINEEERVKKSIEKEKQAKEKQAINTAKEKIKRAKKELEKAEEEYKKKVR